MPIPNAGFPQAGPTDSVVNAVERTDKMISETQRLMDLAKAAEDRRLAREKVDTAEGRRSEDAFINLHGAASSPRTREYILERIRAQREEKPAPPPPIGFNEAQKAQLEAEQEAGRKAVAFHTANNDFAQAARLKAQAEEMARQAALTPVVHPNPGQDEQFPASGATLKAPKKR